MVTRAPSHHPKATGAGRSFLAVVGADCGKVFRAAYRRLPAAVRRRLDLAVFPCWEAVELPAHRSGSVLVVGRLADVPGQASGKTWPGKAVRYLVFLEGLPVEAFPCRVLPLHLRDPHRLHVVAARGVAAAALVRRLVRGMARDDDPPTIVDAWREDDRLVLLSPAFARLSVPLAMLGRYLGSGRRRAEAFEIDEDGRFVYWPHADVHLGWRQLQQIVDPTAALADQQAAADFNRSFGAAIRAFREEAGLTQAQIPGVTDRHLRRVEQGRQRASKATLDSLAKAHRMTLDEYLKALADRLDSAG